MEISAWPGEARSTLVRVDLGDARDRTDMTGQTWVVSKQQLVNW